MWEWVYYPIVAWLNLWTVATWWVGSWQFVPFPPMSVAWWGWWLGY